MFKTSPTAEDSPILFPPGSHLCRVPKPRTGHHVFRPLLELLEPESRVIQNALHGRGQTFHELRLGEPLRLPHSWKHNPARSITGEPQGPLPTQTILCVTEAAWQLMGLGRLFTVFCALCENPRQAEKGECLGRGSAECLVPSSMRTPWWQM